jgi:hypothetical protein
MLSNVNATGTHTQLSPLAHNSRPVRYDFPTSLPRSPCSCLLHPTNNLYTPQRLPVPRIQLQCSLRMSFNFDSFPSSNIDPAFAMPAAGPAASHVDPNAPVPDDIQPAPSRNEIEAKVRERQLFESLKQDIISIGIALYGSRYPGGQHTYSVITWHSSKHDKSLPSEIQATHGAALVSCVLYLVSVLH